MTSSRQPSSSDGLEPGRMIAGKYRVERVLGSGGMGVVIAARHVPLDEMVAIKLMLPDVLGNAEAVARFMAEARAAVKIKSEFVARVSDVDKLETGEPYIVMEFLQGEDLQARLYRTGALPLGQAAEFVIQACDALAEAHSLGTVHRDLKPANLFCITRPDGVEAIKVLDFGISKASPTSAAAVDMTTASKVLGTPLYMSPEQLRSARDVDARSDIWSLGAILWQLITGRPAFQADSFAEVVAKVLREEAPPLSQLRPEVPPGFQAVVSRCLAKEPDQRFDNMAELAEALLPYAPRRIAYAVRRARGVIYGPVNAGDTPFADQAGRAQSARLVRSLDRWRARHPRWLYAIGAAIVLALVSVTALLLAYRSGGAGSATSGADRARAPLNRPAAEPSTTPSETIGGAHDEARVAPLPSTAPPRPRAGRKTGRRGASTPTGSAASLESLIEDRK